MGYTHYYRRPLILGTKEQFSEFTKDCIKIFDYCETKLRINLANGMGEPGTKPVITDDIVIFNGSNEQEVGVWTTNEDISIPWPSDTAGISELSELPFDKTDGTWFGGNLVSQRVAPVSKSSGYGSGSYESFHIERVYSSRSWEDIDAKTELHFECCKTAYRPYDLTVTAVLITLKHHFPECVISTNGTEKDWIDARILCYNLFGYGMEFSFKE